MEVNLDDYFWMIDRLGMEDDTRNKVNKDRKVVQLSKNMTASLVNGYFFSKLLSEIHPTFIKRTRKNFTLDPGVTEMKDNNAVKSRQANWDVIQKAVPKFGVMMLNDKKKKEIVEQNMDSVRELISELQRVDTQAPVKQLLVKERKP